MLIIALSISGWKWELIVSCFNLKPTQNKIPNLDGIPQWVMAGVSRSFRDGIKSSVAGYTFIIFRCFSPTAY